MLLACPEIWLGLLSYVGGLSFLNGEKNITSINQILNEESILNFHRILVGGLHCYTVRFIYTKCTLCNSEGLIDFLWPEQPHVSLKCSLGFPRASGAAAQPPLELRNANAALPVHEFNVSCSSFPISRLSLSCSVLLSSTGSGRGDKVSGRGLAQHYSTSHVLYSPAIWETERDTERDNLR